MCMYQLNCEPFSKSLSKCLCTPCTVIIRRIQLNLMILTKQETSAKVERSDNFPRDTTTGIPLTNIRIRFRILVSWRAHTAIPDTVCRVCALWNYKISNYKPELIIQYILYDKRMNAFVMCCRRRDRCTTRAVLNHCMQLGTRLMQVYQRVMSFANMETFLGIQAFQLYNICPVFQNGIGNAAIYEFLKFKFPKVIKS